MAYIRQVGDKWRAEVERKGVRRSAIWDTEKQAKAWARKVEAEILAGIVSSGRTFPQAAERYEQEVTAKKRGIKWETLRLRAMVEHFQGKLDDIGPPQIAAWRDARLKTVSASTVLREANLLKHIFTIARTEWHWIEHEPFKGVKMPKHEPPREQRWRWREIRRVVRFLGYRTGQPPTTKRQEAAWAFLIALRTAMRASEVLQVGPGTVRGRVVHLVGTKTEKIAKVPLTAQGFRLCSQVKGWTISARDLDAAFRFARDACLVGNLRFHDARATALTLLARKYDVLTLSRISRHKDLRMLQHTYFRESVEEIAARL